MKPEVCWTKGCAFTGMIIVDGHLYCGRHGRLVEDNLKRRNDHEKIRTSNN